MKIESVRDLTINVIFGSNHSVV